MALACSVICEDELIAAIVVPAGMPVPVTDSPTNRFAVLDSPLTTGELNVRLLDPLVVALLVQRDLRGRVDRRDVVPAGMPVPVTDSPTKRFAVLDSPVTTGEVNVRLLPDRGHCRLSCSHSG